MSRDEQTRLEQFLENAKKVVNNWPEWKRRVLENYAPAAKEARDE
jgi:hypothetical protein